MKKIIILSLIGFSFLTANNDMFVELGLGYGETGVKDGNILVSEDSLDKSGITFDIGVGYYFNDKIFSTLNYQNMSFDNINLHNTYLSVNYLLVENIDSKFKPYLGLIGGYSYLKWDEAPIPNTTDNDYNSGQFFTGIQFGVNYSFNDDIDFYGKVQHNNIEQNTYIKGDLLKHENSNLFLIGFSYKIN